MSVIGRLDEQVNDILISPLEKERRRKPDGEPEAPPDDQAGTQQALTIARPQNRASAGKHESSERASSERDELPVWLL
ncbi:MAG TPA: hypothetical protein VF735_16835 [Pyrinomonadaceae bacterium]|jgi:hypothetical protein